jgi:hypothetical protein
LSSSYVQGQACTTPYTAISNEPTLSTIKAAIDKAGLKGECREIMVPGSNCLPFPSLSSLSHPRPNNNKITDTLDNPEFKATLLLPNNGGVTTFLEDAGITLQDLLDFPQLDVFLGGHIVPGPAKFVADLEVGVELDTLVGEDGHVEVSFKKENDPKYAECAGGVHMHVASHSVVEADPQICDIAACQVSYSSQRRAPPLSYQTCVSDLLFPFSFSTYISQAVIHTLDYPLLPHNDEFEEYFPNVEITHELHDDDDDDDDDDDHDDDDHDHDDEKATDSVSNDLRAPSDGSQGRPVPYLAPLGVVVALIISSYALVI